MRYRSLEGEGTHGVALGGDLTFGDVRLRAERIEYDNETLRIAATGGALLTRGDERVSGESLLFDPENGVAVVENGVAVSPPYYVSGERVERTPTGILARNGLVTACPEGKGEFKITARQIELVNDRYLVLRRPTFHLFGARLLSLPRFRYVIRRGRGREREEYALSIPIRIRSSQIAGLVVGASLPFYLGAGYEGTVGADFPSKRPLQYIVTLRRDLLGNPDEERPRGLAADPTRRDEDLRAVSPLRAFLKARPLPPPPDPVLDYEDILPTQDPVSFPTRTPTRDLQGLLSLWGNQEVSNKRRADLLLSRVPEARLVAQFPLSGTVPGENAAARAYLRRPRLLLIGDLALGDYDERELSGDKRNTHRSRVAATVGAGTLPLLVGSRLLVRPQISLTQQAYSRGESYRVVEANLSASYVLGTRTGLGASYIRRFTSGSTPFTFDLVETKDEAQFRAQSVFFGGKYTLGVLGRYDLDQAQFFDFEFALAVRLRCIEPRLSYRRLGQRINFTIVLPGLTL